MTFLGLALGAVGIVLLNFGSAPVPSNAATDYTATWKATNILTVEGRLGTDRLTGEAGIGVWKWEVTGTIGDTNYTETWSAPSIANVSFAIPANKGCNLLNIITDQLLAGCWTDQDNVDGRDTTLYTFRERTPNEYFGKKFDLNAGAGDQKASSCINSPRDNGTPECIYQTGSYNFMHVYDPGFPTRNRLLGSGTLTPLQWTVVGQID